MTCDLLRPELEWGYVRLRKSCLPGSYVTHRRLSCIEWNDLESELCRRLLGTHSFLLSIIFSPNMWTFLPSLSGYQTPELFPSLNPVKASTTFPIK